MLVDLSDVKAHLNIPAATGAYDDELMGFLRAVTTVAEDRAGHIVPLSIVGEVHDGGGEEIFTNETPVISVESITEYIGLTGYPLTSQPPGSTVNIYGYQLLNPYGRIVRRGGLGTWGWGSGRFADGAANVVVSYTVGWPTIPDNVRLGALELVRHWWQRSQQGGRPGFNSTAGDDGYLQAGDYAVSTFVAQLLRSSPYSPARVPGIA